MTINSIDFEEYKNLKDFVNFLENNGFKNKENIDALRLYISLDNFWASTIITSIRIDNDIQRYEASTKKIFEQIRNTNNFDENTGKEGINAIFELQTDLISFYIFMRELLDIITRILKELTKNQSMTNSFHTFMKKYEQYRKDNPKFFNDIFKEKLKRFLKFKVERDGIIHFLSSFFFFNDVNGNLGFDIDKMTNQTTGTSYVISIKKFKDGKISEYLEILDYIIYNKSSISDVREETAQFLKGVGTIKHISFSPEPNQ